MNERWIHGVAWVAFPVLVLVGGSVNNLGGALLTGLVWTSVVALGLLVIGAWFAERRTSLANEEPHIPLWAWIGRNCLHLVPVYLIAMIGVPDSLRFANPQTLFVPTPSPEDPPRWLDSPRTGVQSASAPRSDTQEKMTILDMYYPGFYDMNSPVTVIGRFLGDHELPSAESRLPAGLDGFVYRQVIQCCAADAVPTVAGLRDERPEPRMPLGFPADTWLSINGRWIPPDDSSLVPIILVTSIRTISPPRNPYLSAIAR